MSELKVNKISPRSGTDVTLGDSGDTGNSLMSSGATNVKVAYDSSANINGSITYETN
jgi:hypothetical protein